MTAACDVPCVNNCAASNRRASNAALRRCPCCGVVMPQHRIVRHEIHHFISRDSLVLGLLLGESAFSPRRTANLICLTSGDQGTTVGPPPRPLPRGLPRRPWHEMSSVRARQSSRVEFLPWLRCALQHFVRFLRQGASARVTVL